MTSLGRLAASTLGQCCQGPHWEVEEQMYQKRLCDGEEVYFRYAPPQAFRNESSLEKLPKPPFQGAAAWQCSVYYYWFLFYRELPPIVNEDELWGHLYPNNELALQVSRFFQLHESAGFLEWWIVRGRHLFCEPRSIGVTALSFEEIENGVDYQSRKAGILSDPNIYLRIPVHQDFEKSIEEVRKFLRQAKQEQQRSASRKNREALFPVFSKPVLSALEKTYQAWKLKQSNPDMALAEIAVLAGLASRTDNSDVATRAANASAASRALNQATLIMDWVRLGVFPVTSRAQTEEAIKQADTLLGKLTHPNLERRTFDNAYAKATVDELRKQAAELGLDLTAVR